ncbi:MAG: hypothetical protein IJT01_15020 [Selenomonadaceae bacterium]|nr:hypothetical protein [Selenomonadaceae bacterium]
MLWEKAFSEKGQGMVEYAFVLAVVIVIGAVFVEDTAIGQAISDITGSVVGLFDDTSGQ